MEGNEKRKVQDTKETSDCTLHLQDGRGEKGSDGERLKTSNEEENTKIKRWRRAGKKLRREGERLWEDFNEHVGVSVETGGRL